MPRLMGKDARTPVYVGIGTVVAVLGVVTALEYFGFIDVVPGFGQESSINIRKEPTTRPAPLP